MSIDFTKTIEQQVEGSPSVDSAKLNPRRLELCAALLPVWARHLATARTQSGAAVVDMMSAFSEIGAHLDLAACQSHQITVALAHETDGILNLAQACRCELEPLLAQSHPDVAAKLQKVLGMVQKSVDDLGRLSWPCEQETPMPSLQVERMYVGFQYQDRISQMLSLLHDDMTQLASVLADPAANRDALAPETWLARLASQYVMQDQRQDHAAASGSPAGESLDTTFF